MGRHCSRLRKCTSPSDSQQPPDPVSDVVCVKPEAVVAASFNTGRSVMCRMRLYEGDTVIYTAEFLLCDPTSNTLSSETEPIPYTNYHVEVQAQFYPWHASEEVQFNL
jgi:hypothetical protein